MRQSKNSFRQRLISKFIIGYLSVIVLLCIFSGFLYYQYDKNIRMTGNEILELYGNELDSLLSLSQKHLSNMIYNDSHTQILKYSRSKVQQYKAAYDLKSVLQLQMSLQPSIAGFQFFYGSGSTWYYTYQETVYLDDRNKLKQRARQQMEEGNCNGEWQIISGDSCNYLMLTCGNSDVYISVVISLNAVAIPAPVGNFTSENVVMLYSGPEGVLTSQPLAAELGIAEGTDLLDGYHSGRYLLLSRKTENADLLLTIFIPLRSFNAWAITLLIILLFIVLTISIVLYSYSYIQRVFIIPLNHIHSTILKINAGELDERIQEHMAVTEYGQIAESFNEMMEQIKHLKIQTYEERLQKETANFQYLQIQVQPHFFLNCLKILYTLSQQKKYEKLENLILELSKYFRYVFRNNMDIITLEDELSFTRSYLSLLENTSLIHLEYTTDIPGTLLNAPAIPLLIQTFVENSVKYARVREGILFVRVKAVSLKVDRDEYINITVSDNGQGYSAEWIETINGTHYHKTDGNHIGILNLTKRLQLKFGHEADIIVRNHNGAVSEIIYPIQKGEDE